MSAAAALSAAAPLLKRQWKEYFLTQLYSYLVSVLEISGEERRDGGGWGVLVGIHMEDCQRPRWDFSLEVIQLLITP